MVAVSDDADELSDGSVITATRDLVNRKDRSEEFFESIEKC